MTPKWVVELTRSLSLLRAMSSLITLPCDLRHMMCTYAVLSARVEPLDIDDMVFDGRSSTFKLHVLGLGSMDQYEGCRDAEAFMITSTPLLVVPTSSTSRRDAGKSCAFAGT